MSRLLRGYSFLLYHGYLKKERIVSIILNGNIKQLLNMGCHSIKAGHRLMVTRHNWLPIELNSIADAFHANKPIIVLMRQSPPATA